MNFNTYFRTQARICTQTSAHRYLHTHTVSSNFMNNTAERVSAGQLIYESLCFAPWGLFFPSSFLHPSYSVQFPAAFLLSLFLSLLHLSFLTHSWGVGFPQLVHISAPISLTAPASLVPFFILSLLLYLMLTSASPGWLFGFQWAKRSELILIHSCNVYHLLTFWFLDSPILILLPNHSSPFSFVLILSSYHSTFLSKTPPPPPPPPLAILLSAMLNNSILHSPSGHQKEVSQRKRESINQLTFQSLDHSLAWLGYRWPIHCTVVLYVYASMSQVNCRTCSSLCFYAWLCY